MVKRVEEVRRGIDVREVVEMLRKARGVPEGYALASVRREW